MPRHRTEGLQQARALQRHLPGIVVQIQRAARVRCPDASPSHTLTG